MEGKKIHIPILLLLMLSLTTAVLVITRRVETSNAAVEYCTERFMTYLPDRSEHAFGQYVLHEQGWDRYLMYFSSNSTVNNGTIGVSSPGDKGTYNDACNTWYADRIWYTWHFGDGKDPNGWDADDGYGNTPPTLALGIGGRGETALIGDPAVVEWGGKYHMYYEGTDRCDGMENLIFHATSDSIFGPWTKQGEVQGLGGQRRGSGLSWPSVYIENNTLYLLYTDGHVALLMASTTNPDGHSFIMENEGKPPLAEQVNDVDIRKIGAYYYLVYDTFMEKGIKITRSTNKLSFPPGLLILDKRNNGWEDLAASLPSFVSKYQTGESLDRIYYKAKSLGSGDRTVNSVALCTLNMESLPYIYPTATPIPIPGDATGEGAVDIEDYIVWTNNYNTSTQGGTTNADFNNDGKVDGGDYVIWLLNYSK